MKITKYPQSCLLIEDDQTRLVIDPGKIFSESYDLDELGEIDAVLYTHQHADHFDESLIADFIEASVDIYANESTAELIEDEINVISDGDVFEIGDFGIEAKELPHMLLPDGSEGPQNTGYVINGNFFHPGDGIEAEDLSVETLAAPFAGPDVSPKTLLDFIKSSGAKNVIPIHNDVFKVDAKVIVGFYERFGVELN